MSDLNSKKRTKTLGILAGVVVFTWVWTYLILRPIFEYRDKLDADLSTKNLKFKEAKKILNASPQRLNPKEALKRFISENSSQEDMAKMIKDIEAAAVASGLRVLETKPQPQTNNVGWFELKVSIVFEGNWSDVVRFLYEIESVTKPLFVNEMSLEANLPQQTTVRGRLEIGRILATADKAQ